MFRDGSEVSPLCVGGSIQCCSIWHSWLEGIFSGHLSLFSLMELPIPPAAGGRTRLAGA